MCPCVCVSRTFPEGNKYRLCAVVGDDVEAQDQAQEDRDDEDGRVRDLSNTRTYITYVQDMMSPVYTYNAIMQIERGRERERGGKRGRPRRRAARC